MAAPKSTTWTLEAHTRAKHEILKRYLQAWMPILSHGGFAEILYVDGFAGPGIYDKGEDGSPVIAVKTALGYEPPLRAKLNFLFIEKEEDRAACLSSIVNSIQLPSNFDVNVEEGSTFEEAFRRHYDDFIKTLGRLPPTFAFIDPFGWTGAPFSLVAKIMTYPSCEVLVTFMYEEINRFIGHPDQASNFDNFFGCRDWRDSIGLLDPQERNRFLHDLYIRQLRQAARVKFVRSFQMRNDRDVTDYYLFYATNNLLGLKRMKEAMWKVDQLGEFSFSDATDQDQIILFSEPRFDVLRRQIIEHFGKRETTRDEVEHYVVAETAFRETHYKRQVLKPMEEAGELEVVDPPPGRKAGTYSSSSLRLRFH